MRCLQKLVKNGNATQVTVPRAAMNYLKWNAGEFIIVELLEQNAILIRKPTEVERATFIGPRPFTLLEGVTPR